jgi:hypothetical protein
MHTSNSRDAISGPNGVNHTTSTNNAAVISSTSGYCQDTLTPHLRQRPRSNAQLRTGMLSNHRSE